MIYETQVLARLVTLMPQEGDTNVAEIEFYKCAQLGATGEPEIKLPPEQYNEYNIMVELKKLKPELTQFIEDYNTANLLTQLQLM